MNSNGWTKDIVENYDCGYYVDVTKPRELAKLLIRIRTQRDELLKRGKNARKLAETKYDKSILCKEFADIIEQNFVSKTRNLFKELLKMLYKRFFKRFFDMVIASVGLIILSPLFLILWIGLSIANNGAGAFFLQERPAG